MSGPFVIGAILSPAEIVARLGGTDVSLKTLTAINAATQDAVRLQGRAGGTASRVATLTPAALGADRTYTFPDASGNVALDSFANVFSNLNTFDRGAGATIPQIVADRNIQLANATNIAPTIQCDGYGTAAGLNILCRSAGGTAAAPSATPAGRIIAQFLGYGHNGSALTTSPAARYQILASENWTGSGNGTNHVWFGTPNASTTAAEWMRLVNGGLAIGATALLGTERIRSAGGGSILATVVGATDVLLSDGAVKAGRRLDTPGLIVRQTGASGTSVISRGSIAAGDTSFLVVDGEGAAADDLDTITGGTDGQILILRSFSSLRTITVRHFTGNIYLDGAANKALTSARDTIVLVFFSSFWHQIAFSNNA